MQGVENFGGYTSGKTPGFMKLWCSQNIQQPLPVGLGFT